MAAISPELQRRNEAFLAFLDTLNPAQREAVDQVEGPVLVLAGPGTGKTHLLTARIGNILLRTDARPQNVLCLTFTDAGATTMRQRLLQRIGPEAQRVPIFTFHAFCNRIIQDNSEYFAQGNPEPITDLERIDLIRGLLDKLAPTHPLRLGKKDPYASEAQLRDLFSSMKKEAWTPGFVRRKCAEFLKSIPENPTYIYQRKSKEFQKGDLKAAQIQEVTEKIERLKAAADLFPKYLNALQKAARYEYEDMILWVSNAFKEHPALLLTYQERYQYILVDEFQDNNGAQFQLLNWLLDFWTVPNIFIVGDDDQSIYEFQGARLENLRTFQNRYEKGLKTILLVQNYRSTQPILDAASRVIDHNLLRVEHLLGKGKGKQLQSQMDWQNHLEAANFEEPMAPQLRAFPNRLQETAFVVQQIEALLESGIPAQEIAVLYAKHRQAERLLNLLGKKGIPYQTKRPINVLDLPVVQHFRALLQYLDDEMKRPFAGEHHLFRLLHAAFWGLSSLDLAHISMAIRSKFSAQNEGMETEKSSLRWRELLNDEAGLQALPLQNPTACLRVGRLLNDWILAAQNEPLPRLLEQLWTQSGLLEWALNQPDKAWYLQVLNTLQTFVENETSRHPRRKLSKILELFDRLDENRLSLPLLQASIQTNGIQLLTAHAAKGLEFAHVFMLDCTEDTWDKNAGGNRGRFFLPDTLTRSGEEDALEARRRLFYVAMTRAKYQLNLSVARADDAGKAIKQSQFLAETGLAITEYTLPNAVVLTAQALLLQTPTLPPTALPNPVLLNTFLANFSLSITAFNRYLRCPLAFYYEDILQVPAAPSEPATFGFVMHSTAQKFVLAMKMNPKYEWPSVAQLLTLFEQEMTRQQGNFTTQHFKQRMAIGQDYWPRICAEQLPHWRKRAIVERRIDRVELQGVPMNGVLDKLEWLDGKNLRIVDYKTGTPDPKRIAPPSEAQPFGGEYWRQLAFYHILLDEANLYTEKVSKTAISWLAPDKKGYFPLTEILFSTSELQFVSALIQQVYAKIQQRAFDIGCGESDCVWCQMQRENTLSDTLERGFEDDLDD